MSLPRAYILCFSSILAIVLMALIGNFVPEAFELYWFLFGMSAYAVLLLWGMAVWAGAKGYPPLVGIALGLFCSWVGLFILVFLPDKGSRRR